MVFQRQAGLLGFHPCFVRYALQTLLLLPGRRPNLLLKLSDVLGELRRGRLEVLSQLCFLIADHGTSIWKMSLNRVHC
jgi:hypothetical protein